MGSDNSYRINPILSDIIENKKVTSSQQDKQYREQVEEWKKLLAEKDPWIEPQKFIELFDMYDFDASEPESKDFFSFKNNHCEIINYWKNDRNNLQSSFKEYYLIQKKSPLQFFLFPIH